MSEVEKRPVDEQGRPIFDPITRPSSPYLDGILGKPFWLHNKGFLRCVDYAGTDASIVQAARVSYGAGTTTSSDDKSLISYLMENRHSTPFEMCVIKFHVKAPIFIARQWFRHRTSSFNEYSGRYSIMDGGFYIPDESEICAQSKSNKQGRGRRLSKEESARLLEILECHSLEAERTYTDMIDSGLAKELARMGLTLNTYTEWYWEINAHNLFHFLGLRFHPHAQKEIRDYAEVIFEIVKGWLPFAAEAFENFRLNGASFSGAALAYLQMRIDRPYDDVPEPKGMSRREKKKIDQMFPSRKPSLFKRVLDRVIANLCYPQDR